MADLFGTLERPELKPEPLITWDDDAWTGRTTDGRLIRFDQSDWSLMFVATIPLKSGAVTRRARKDLDAMKTACADALKEEANA